MRINILGARTTRDDANGYVAHIQFEVEGHRQPYEATLQSDKGNEWSHSLFFLNESGSEEEIDAVEEALDTDDELFGTLIDAAEEAWDKSQQ
ncbi:hypothetical protein COLU111180_11700 [Cohnella lubricantis]|uniref:Uncharacterized protein n=1 Tax=Cohnella lubricantis TaxID=2163172 RepID=A0A841T833_9BACL|nr:hypothetical protein [Cohnella lubricantis]MBB6676155.1 hypothetical protein [Cohnella lubricantis]MBP2118653.1 hypothetical protein [Cohnella lubricantis]